MAGHSRQAPILTRVAVAEMAGLLIGILAFALLPAFLPDIDDRRLWGILLWYPTLGAAVALVDMVEDDALPVPVPWWLRAAVVGAWLNFIATLLVYDMMAAFMAAAFGAAGEHLSPYWFVAEGAAAAVLIGYLVTRFGGDGRGIGDD